MSPGYSSNIFRNSVFAKNPIQPNTHNKKIELEVRLSSTGTKTIGEK